MGEPCGWMDNGDDDGKEGDDDDDDDDDNGDGGEDVAVAIYIRVFTSSMKIR